MNKLKFGAVKVIGGRHKGRIGYYDDDDTEKTAIVYFSGFVLLDGYYLIQHRYLAEANIKDLLIREQVIREQIKLLHRSSESLDENTINEIRLQLVSEAFLISQQLALHRFIWRDQSNIDDYHRSIRLFISYSHEDKNFAKRLAYDLELFGIDIWFDEWKVFAGDSIPKKLGEGSDECDFMLILFSKNSKASRWQEKEWESKLIDEVNNDSICLIPLKIEECKIPPILKPKRYINFINAANDPKNYYDGLQEILRAIRHHLENKPHVVKLLLG